MVSKYMSILENAALSERGFSIQPGVLDTAGRDELIDQLGAVPGGPS
jgi:hypothetical protein